MTQLQIELDATLVNTVVKATTDVLGTMANTAVTFKEVWAENDYHPHGDISAMIGILGERGEGMITISFSQDLAALIVSRLIGLEPSLLSADDCADGVGELVNMISGQTKTNLSQGHGAAYKLSLPTIIRGANHQISSYPKNVPVLNAKFETEGQVFNLQIAFKTA